MRTGIIEKRKRFAAFALVLALLLCLAPARAASPKAVFSRQTLRFNGKDTRIDAYNIDGYNYFRLRDIAALMQNTIFRFSLETDADQKLVRAHRFRASADTLAARGEDKSATARKSAWRLTADGEPVRCEVYNIGGSNYYRLRDLSDVFGFSVGYDAEKKRVLVAAETLTGTQAQENACFAALETLYVGKDYENGLAALEKAAKDGSARAFCELAHAWYYGQFGLEADAAKAFEYALAAAKGANTRGLYLYALLLWNGQGTEKDRAAAIACFERAAAQGSVPAQSFLCANYSSGDALGQDDLLACKYAKAAADFGDPRACYVYGRCLYSGSGTEKDAAQALRFFRTAGEGGIVEAIHALGVCYYQGEGAAYNPYIALHYFELAAAQGYAPSAYNAGLCYAGGVGTEQDLKKAAQYMRAAADGGLQEAAAWLAEYA